ncbi:MAG TPA: hypothetical protein VF516_38305, partial [Kofleriaceae bacterium]
PSSLLHRAAPSAAPCWWFRVDVDCAGIAAGRSVVDMPPDDSNPRARRGARDLAGLRASIVRLPDSRPKSGRTPDNA